jgi:hypothetical protein
MLFISFQCPVRNANAQRERERETRERIVVDFKPELQDSVGEMKYKKNAIYVDVGD